MTAPDRTTWTVAEDGEHEPTLWRGSAAIRRRSEVTEAEWQVLTAVLAPDEATIERLARAMVGDGCATFDWDDLGESSHDLIREDVRIVLAALAGTSAQARHTADWADEPGDPTHERIDEALAVVEQAKAEHLHGALRRVEGGDET